jgi:hypothetical protein
MELMKTNRFKRIFLPIQTMEQLGFSNNALTAFDLACSMSHFPHHRTTPLILVLGVGEELTEEQEEHRMALYPFVGIMRMPLNSQAFWNALATSKAAVEMNVTPALPPTPAPPPIHAPTALSSATYTATSTYAPTYAPVEDASTISIFVINAPNVDGKAFGTLLEEISKPIGKP